MKAVILAGGRLVPGRHLVALCSNADLVVAADSGLRHATMLGLQPAAVVGDFDSVSPAELEAYPEIPRIEHSVDKDELDLELAIDLALERGATELVVLGAFGTRLDQSLAALLIGCRHRSLGLAISLHDGDREAHPLVAPDALRLDIPDGTLFSLLALEEARCTVRRARFPLENAHLPFGTGLGLANRAEGTPLIEIHDGVVAVIVEREVV